MKILACLMLVAVCAGCQTSKPDRPKYDVPYPITGPMEDPETDKPVRTR